MRNINLQLFALTLNTKTSIVDYLKSTGQDSSYANRKKLAGQYGISNYTGTADQNTKLLQKMQNASSASASSTNKQSGTSKTASSAVKNSVADKVLDFAASAKKNSAGSDTVVKDAADLLEQRTEQTFASNPAVSTPLVSEYIPKAETPQTNPVEMPTVSTSQFKPVDMPTFTPQTNVNIPTYTPVEMPTYTPNTQPAQQATPLKDRLDQATLDKLNSQFVVSDAYNKAMEYTNGLLQNLNSGRTQYTDQISQLIKDFQNREKFSYDSATDPLFQQMLGSAMQSGNLAMQDTMGQAAALTGGYGSSYSQAVGNNAYNQYIQEAYNNLPEYYQLAMDAYNMEGQNMLNQISLLDAADSKEYDRMFNAWNTNYQNAQDMYNKEYGAWRDSVADAYNYAGLQNDDYWNNLEYNESIRQNEQNFQYQQYLDQLKQSQWQNEFNYQQYLDQMNQANADRDFQYQQYRDQVAQNQWQNEFNYGQYMDQVAQNQWKDEFDYQKEQDKAAQDRWQNEFDYEKEQDKQAQTNYENEFNYQKEQDKQSQSNWEQQFEYGKEQDALSQSNWEKQFAQDVIEFDKSFAEEQRQFDQSLREDQRQYDTSMKFNKDQAKEEQARWEKEQAEKGASGNSGSGEAKLSNLTNTEIENVKEIYTEAGGGMNGNIAVDRYLTMIGKNNVDNETLASMLASVEIPLEYQNWTIDKDTNNGGFLWWKGEDHNDTYKYGDEILTYDELVERIEESDLSDAKKKELKKKLKEQSKN
ncbi:MAG: DUF3597 family protein [Lachnospiraceae bacterium]|nr:DUF3597 family protein [Lachnospiraceae bacterium]